MGWYNDNLQQYNNAQTKYTANEMFSGNNGPGTEALSYKTNLGGKDYFYSPQQTTLGNRVGVKSWDDSTAKSLGGVDWTRQIYNDPGAQSRSANLNYGPNTSGTPQMEKGYLFETDPNAGKNTQYQGLKNGSWWQNQGLGLAAIAAAPFAVSAGLGATGAGTAGATPISGGGAASLSAPTAGGALAAPSSAGGGGMLAGSIPAYTPEMSAAGMGAGGFSSVANGAGSTLGAASSAGASGSSMFSGLGDMFSGLSGGQKLGLGTSVADLALRLNQQRQLRDIADKSSQMANPLNDPQRQQYQQLLSQYLNGGQDITQQPIVKSEMDAMKRAAEAQMAKAGMTGSGNAGNIMSDYMLEAINRTSQPYLNFLAGAGGFNGSGNGAGLYANLNSQATAAPFQGLQGLGNALSDTTNNQAPWWSSAYNAQQQMMGRGTNSNLYGIS